MIINSNPKTPNRTLNIGDMVIIKTDFDNNSQNRRKAFDSFFEDDLYEAVEVISNSMDKIKGQDGNARNIHKNRLKKY